MKLVKQDKKRRKKQKKKSGHEEKRSCAASEKQSPSPVNRVARAWRGFFCRCAIKGLGSILAGVPCPKSARSDWHGR